MIKDTSFLFGWRHILVGPRTDIRKALMSFFCFKSHFYSKVYFYLNCSRGQSQLLTVLLIMYERLQNL